VKGKEAETSWLPSFLYFVSAAINSSDRHSTSPRIAKTLTWYRSPSAARRAAVLGTHKKRLSPPQDRQAGLYMVIVPIP
jgi:hypothetical protein